MVHRLLFDHTPDIMLKKLLDKAALAQRVISANVANVNTPGYEKLGVSFDEKLQKALRFGRSLKRTQPGHLPSPEAYKSIEPEIVKVEDDYWNGVNNVNIDDEMVQLAKNQLDFTISSQLLGRRYSQLRTAIRGRR